MNQKCALLVESNHHLQHAIAASRETEDWCVFEAKIRNLAEPPKMHDTPGIIIVEHQPASEADSALIDAFHANDGEEDHFGVPVLDRPAKEQVDIRKAGAVINKPSDVHYLQGRMGKMIQEKGGDGC